MHPGHLARCLMRFTADIATAINAAVPEMSTQYWAWENRTDETALPHTALIGLADFSFDDSSKIWVSRFSIVFSTYRDVNMLNESYALDVIYDKAKRLNKIPLLENHTGQVFSEAIITAMTIQPTDQSMIRNYRPISIEIHPTGPDQSYAGSTE